MSVSEGKTLIVDAEGQILGRMASRIAKLLLQGYKVVVVNAEKAVLSGDPQMVIGGYSKMFSVRNYRNLEKQGIRRERSPQRLVKSAIKGMLPYKKPKGRGALKNLRVYVGVPEEFKGREKIRFPEADASKLKCKSILVGQLARQLGWRVLEA
uniref:Large ribosomal subunit protein uL13 n=1 Tax=Fervidicoccus fontis TaxID=683846 RepID=A0A7J3ZLB5_9CREN